MKKSKLICIIIATALILLGALLAAISLAVVRFDFTKLQPPAPGTQKTFSFNAQSLTSLVADGTWNSVTIVGDDRKAGTIEYNELDNTYYDITFSQTGILNIRFTDSRTWTQKIGVNSTSKITVYLPAAAQADLTIRMRSGNILIQELKLTGDIHLETSSGSILATQIQTDAQFTAATSSGGAHLSRIQTGKNLSITSNSGIVSIHDAVAEQALQAQTASGSIVLADITAVDGIMRASSGTIKISGAHFTGALTCETNSGSLRLTDSNADGDTSLKSGSGNVVFEQFTCKNLNIETRSGDVRGSLSGAAADYTVICSTRSGNINAPQGGNGPYRIHITTGSGNIRLNFSS